MTRLRRSASALVVGAFLLSSAVAGPALARGGHGGGHGGGGPGPGAGHFGGGHFGGGHPGFGPGGPRPGWGGHPPGWARPGWSGWGGRRVWVPRHPSVVIGGGFFYNPYAYPYYPYYAYGYPPAYGYDWYPPPPPSEGEYQEEAPPPPSGEAPEPPDAPDDDALGAPDADTGLVQLLDVPDGATLSLDGRYWLEAHSLEGHWFRLPAGTHTISIRATGHASAERRVDVVAGGQQVVRLAPSHDVIRPHAPRGRPSSI
jgi:hypothetical protein